MSLVFLAPSAALDGIVALAVLAATFIAWRRVPRWGEKKLLSISRLWTRSIDSVAAVSVIVLLAVASAGPALVSNGGAPRQGEIEVCLVFDVSRSMAARSDPESETRLERAKDIARSLRAIFPDVPMCTAAFTDRVVIHTARTIDPEIFEGVLRSTILFDHPPPQQHCFDCVSTSLTAIRDVFSKPYFSDSAREKILFVFTDGEVSPLSGNLLAHAWKGSNVQTTFVKMGNADERIFRRDGSVEPYVPQANAREILEWAADAVEGNVVSEGEIDTLFADLYGITGVTPIGWLFALAAFVPLTIVIIRRNR